MRILSASLEAAQKSASGVPYVKAVFSDFAGDRPRLRFERLYEGSETPWRHAVCGAGDGSLVRARIDEATSTLYVQRVANPGPGSDFSAWSSLGTVRGHDGSVALVCAEGSATVRIFYVDADTTTLRMRVSADYGASWGSASTVSAAGGAKEYICADVADDGDVVVFWSEAGNVIYTSRFNGTSWSARTAWTNSIAGIRGMACVYADLDWNLVVCGQETTTLDSKVWVAVYGDGGSHAVDTWGGLQEIATAAADSGVEFYDPGLALQYAWRLFFLEFFSGSVTSVRVHRCEHDFVAFEAPEWSDPAAFPCSDSFGVAAAARNFGAYVWLSAPAGVWRSRSPANDDLDVTDDVIEASVDLDEDDGRVRLVLRNDAPDGSGQAGRYTGYGAGALGSLRRGTRLLLSPGYRTTEGPETTDEAGFGPAYWVESVEVVTGPQPRLVVNARDGWWLLERWRARRQFSFSGQTVASIIGFICARAGLLAVNAGESVAIQTLTPSFTVHPGESAKTAIARLLAMVPDVAYFQSANLALREAAADDDAVYAFGAGHALVETRLRDLGPAHNRVRVAGLGVFDDDLDYDDIESMGERADQVVDLNLDAGSEATDRAAYGLRRAEVHARRDELTAFGVSCAQELYDVVEVTDARAGLDAARRRVLGLRWRYDATGPAPRYDMTLRLGLP